MNFENFFSVRAFWVFGEIIIFTSRGFIVFFLCSFNSYKCLQAHGEMRPAGIDYKDPATVKDLQSKAKL